MVFRVQYFGRLEELTGKSEEQIKAQANTVAELRAAITNLYPGMAEASYSVAVNQQIADGSQTIDTEAEIALLPPFSGG